MKTRLLSMNRISIVVFMMVLSGCMAGCTSSGQHREMEFGKLKEEFRNPSGSFRSAPLWVWNTKVTHADIDRMLGELKEQGFGGAFVHPRPGMITEYLSDDWFDLYKYSVEKGKELGLDIWIYDENSYPSGFAGGHVPARMPESYNQGQGLAYTKTDILPQDIKDCFICLKKENDTFRDITAELDRYKDKKGEYYLYRKTFYGRSAWHGGYSYVDLLYPGVTEKFMQITMEGYEKTFGKDLGPVVKGIFTDEPNVASPGGIRWTPDLFEVFSTRWGYDLKEFLPLLVEESGNWKQVRHNYMETLTQLFIDRWAKPWFEYCEEKGLLWTGHYWEHGWPDMSHGGDNMAMYAWHQMPAVDMLFNQFNDSHPQAQFGNVRAVKELRSVANQMGYVRTLSETYGGGGWDMTFEDLKRLGDWEYVLGVNFMNQHLSRMTIVGARKYDYPPVFTSLTPWWEDYKTQNDYFARLSLLLSQGEQMNDLLVLEPTTSAWLYFSYPGSNPRIMDVGQSFQTFVTTLEKHQVEYDLGSENIIKDQGKAKSGKFIVGKRAYKKVVLPPNTENLNAVTFRLIEQFVDGGGELVLFSTPVLIDGKESSELADFFTRNAARIKSYTELTEQVMAESFRNEKIQFAGCTGNDLYHQRRTYDDGELLFVVNSSLTEVAGGSVAVRGKNCLELDGMSGEIYKYPHTETGDYIETKFSLPPAGSLILFIPSSGSKQPYAFRPKMAGTRKLEAATPLNVKRLADNVLMVDFCDLSIDGNVEHNLYTVEACNKLYRHFGMNDPWNSAIQYRQTIVEKDTFRTGNIQVRYAFVVSGNTEGKEMKLVAEQPGLWKVKLNGKELSPASGESCLDSRFGVYAIGDYIRPDTNTVELSVSPMSIYAEISPVYIVGDFSLEPASSGWVIEEPAVRVDTGSWKEQGMPFYSWDMAYSKNYNIQDTSARYALQLNNWKGTVAEVFVNDNKAGVIAYQPYRFDLSPYLKVGNNTIEVRVVGSLKNLFGPHYNHDRGIAGPWHWNNVGKQLPGNEYDLLDYGLMEDFSVMASK